ncbi:MAG: citrate (Si)-synthase, partial [Lapillicoccus sp.]
MSTDTAATRDLSDGTLSLDGKTLSLPVVKATDGSDAIGVSSLLKETGKVTYDAGFVNTASCKSAITYIDG